MTRSTRVLLIIGFAVFCIAILAGATFLIVRMQPVRPSVSQYPDYLELHRFDPDREGGHLLPDFNGLVTGERVDQPVGWVTNSKGFRSEREYSYQPEEGVFRVLLLGDSYDDGMRTAQGKTIGALLETALNRVYIDEFHSTEVLISGHNNPANAWYYHQEHGRKYQPHVVILGVTLGNDLT